MPKHVIFSEEARNALMSGIENVADTVQATLGPKGRNVALGYQDNSRSSLTTESPLPKRLSSSTISRIWALNSWYKPRARPTTLPGTARLPPPPLPTRSSPKGIATSFRRQPHDS